MSHKFGARRRLEQTTKANNGRYRAGRQRLPYQWLGVGAVALGIGAAFSSGSGIAHAQGADANSSHSPSAGGRPATGVPTNAHGPTDNGSLGSLRRSHDNVMSRRHAAPTTTLSSSGGHPGGTTAGPSGGSFRTGAALPVRAKLVLRVPAAALEPDSASTATILDTTIENSIDASAERPSTPTRPARRHRTGLPGSAESNATAGRHRPGDGAADNDHSGRHDTVGGSDGRGSARGVGQPHCQPLGRRALVLRIEHPDGSQQPAGCARRGERFATPKRPSG